jgi:serine phosphatase RsbU (regulator of sigma subunit)
MMSRHDLRWAFVIAVALGVITGVRLVVEDSAGLGLSLPSVGPIALAAYCFGMRGALLTAAVATLLFALTSGLPGHDAVVGTVTRGTVFFGMGALVAELLRRTAEQSALIGEQRGEIEELRVLREALTPSSVPHTEGIDVATAYVAAEGAVAGDFFLVVAGPDGSTLLAVGDAVGHDVAAARRASFVRAVLATFAASTADPAQLLSLANTALMESGPDAPDFITAVCASLHGDRLTWASAGHPAPWDLDTGEALRGAAPREPLGLTRNIAYESSSAELLPGAGILLFSDGLPEARSTTPGSGTKLFGEYAAQSELRARPGASPRDVVRTLATAATTFAGGHLADDLCLLAARRVD